jgi:hypothetical protein
MASPLPLYVATYGKDAKIGEKVRDELLPEIQVVHTCLDADKAVEELPRLCGGDLSVSPSSTFGTNAQSPIEERKTPVAVFFGGGFEDSDYSRISEAVSAANPNIKFIKVQKRDVLLAGSIGPNPKTIAKIFKERLNEALAN